MSVRKPSDLDGTENGGGGTGTTVPTATGASDSDTSTDPRERRKTGRLLAYWEGLRRGREFPALADVDPAEIPDLWPFCLVIRVTGDPPSFEFQHVGSALAEGYGLLQKAAIAGMSHGDTVFGKAVSLAHAALSKRTPLQESGSFVNEWGGEVKYRCVVMPLSGDEKTVDCLLGLAGYAEIRNSEPNG